MKTQLLIVQIFLLVVIALSCSKKASEKEYFDLASQYMDQQNWGKAEEYFAKVLQDYPSGLFSSKALFMVGYINANHIKNYDKARKYYSEFLEKYPDHELAAAAKYEIDNMGKEIDELPFLKDDQGQTAGGSEAKETGTTTTN